jgi:hypothetical protein
MDTTTQDDIIELTATSACDTGCCPDCSPDCDPDCC